MRVQQPEWSKWESDVSGMTGGRVTPGSGNGHLFKGDVVTADMLGDCKYTIGKAYSLSLVTWSKVTLWARNEGKVPMVLIRFGGARDSLTKSGFAETVVMPEIDFYGRYDVGVARIVDKTRTGARSFTLHPLGDEMVVFSLGNQRLIQKRMELDED